MCIYVIIYLSFCLHKYIYKSLLINRWSEKVCHKKAPILLGSGNFILRLFWNRFRSHSRNESESTTFKSFFFKTSIFKLAQDECQLNVTLRQGPNERESLARTGAALIFTSFPEVLTGITALAITDSFSLRLRKLMYCKQ